MMVLASPFAEHASEQRRHTQKREPVRRHPCDGQAFRASIAHPVHGIAAGADDVFERLGLLLVVQELWRRKGGTSDDAIGRVLDDHINHAIRMGIGKRVEQDVAEKAIDHRHRPDAERECHDGDGSEGGRSRQCSKSVADVASRIFEPAKRSRVALELLCLLHAAERTPCRQARLLRGHAAPLKLLFQEREVGGDLPREIAFRATRASETSQPLEETPQA